MLGILALVSCWTVIGGVVLGIVAIVLGVLGRSRAKRGQASNGGMAVAGIVTGALGLLASVAIGVVVGVAFFSVGGDDLVRCQNDAAGNQAELAQCQREFDDRNN